MGKGWAAVLALLIFCVGFGTVDSEYVLDAQRVVANNQLIDEGSFSDIMSGHWWYGEADITATLYRPVPVLWFALVGRLGSGREDPKPFHVGSLFLHVANALARFGLLLLLLHRFRQRFLLAFLASLIPAVHAVSFESVACMVGTAEILASLFMTLSWASFVAGMRGRGPSAGALFLFSSAVLWFFALLSKETSVLFPLVLFVQWWCDRGTQERSPAKGGVALAAVLFVASALGWWTLRGLALGGAAIDFSGGPYSEFTALERIESALAVIGSQYLPALFFPFDLMPNLTHQDVPPPTSFLAWPVVAGSATVGFVAFAFTRAFVKKHVTAPLLALAIVTFLPVSNLIVGIGTVGGYRLLYSPLFGLLGAAVVFLGVCPMAKRSRQGGMAVLGTISIVACIATFPLISAWKDSRSLARYAMGINPRSVFAMQNDIASAFTSGLGTVDFKAFTEAFDALDVIEPTLATLPGRERLDKDTRVICFRLYMQRAGAEGTYATTLRDAGLALEHIQRGIRAAQKAEEYGWGHDDHVFDARLVALRLRLVALDHALKSNDLKEQETILVEANGDLEILENLTEKNISQSNHLAFLFEAARFAQMQKKPDLVDYYVARGLAIDKTDPSLTVMRATRLYQERDIKGAYAVMEPLIESGKGGIEEYFLAAELCRHLGKNVERQKLLQQAMRLDARNENEARLRGRIAQMLNGS